MLPKLGSNAFNLLKTDTGGDDLTATGDGDKDTFKVETELLFSQDLEIRLLTCPWEFGSQLVLLFELM